MRRTFQTSRAYPGIPTPAAIEMPILQYVADGRGYAFGDIYSAMADHFELTDEQRRKCFSSANSINPDGVGGQHVFYKYCNRACRSLLDKEWLKDQGEGGFYDDIIYQITRLGQEQVAN